MKFSLMPRKQSYFFENIHEDLERFLKETFGELEPVMPDNSPFTRRFHPAVEIYENDKEYKIDVELAGAKKENICVELTKNSVTINATIKFEKKETKDNLHFSEFRYGEFTRNIPLGKEINTVNSSCEYKDGILHLTLMKKDVENKEETVKLAVN